jgi:phosphoribosylamine--glycine ligase
MKVLVIGSGGREHAIGWALSKAPEVKKLFFGPGNGGTSLIGSNVPLIKPMDFKSVESVVTEQQIDLVVCGPEDPLVNGIYDYLQEKGIKTIGPSAKGARLEGFKSFAKEFMFNMGIPTAKYLSFTDPSAAIDHINSINYEPVIKCEGLAAGKGVLLPKNKDEAKTIIQDIMVLKKFGDSGNKIVIEQKLKGFETTLLSFVDGDTILPMLFSQDYKRAFDKNEGLNTGGMGCLCPSPMINNDLREEIIEKTVKPTSRGLREFSIPYKGIMYFGLMITNDGPYLLEYNIRMGDPETQVVLPLLKTSIVKPLVAITETKLKDEALHWDYRKCAGVILASKGYPGSYEKGVPINYLKKWDQPEEDFIVFHAGTKRDGDNLVTSGGRVVCLTALGESFRECREKISGRIKDCELDGLFYRSDIAAEYA